MSPNFIYLNLNTTTKKFYSLHLKLANDLIIKKSLKSVSESSWLHGVKI